MIDVLRAGVLTTVQDLGRHGLRHLGICQAGALDALALNVANRLVGNVPNAAGIEITLGPVALRFTRDVRIALTGADFSATLDDEPLHAWWSLPVRAGQVLTLRAPRHGMRAYVAVAGGIDVIALLGSRSTDLQAGFGGLGGRALRDGDRLPIGAAHHGRKLALGPETSGFGVKSPALCAFGPMPVAPGAQAAGSNDTVIRVLPGPEFEQFTAAAQTAFWQHPWRVTPNSNRMGYRLAGPALERGDTADLLSHGVLPGTIQVPPSGQPIVLMSDAQTSGGYPKIAAVISADLWRLAQARLNAPLRFVPVDASAARRALWKIEQYLQQVDLALQMRCERIQAGQ
jgi:5-oxoprolinase (ATP-hydrolysing) subunit C